MNTLENNKLIAEFMGFKKAIVRNTKGISYDYDLPNNFELIKETETTIESEWCEILLEQDYCMIEDLKFHSDWNWLIQVVDKIYEMDLYYDRYIDYNSSMISNGKINLGTRINRVYEQVVEFIKWYNEQNK